MPQTLAAVTDISARGYARPEVLVSTDWVEEHRNDPKLRLLESNEDVLLYETGHIPGAVKIDWVTELNDPLVRDYVDRARFERLLRAKGITTTPRSSSTATRTTGGQRMPSGRSSCSASRISRSWTAAGCAGRTRGGSWSP